MVDRISTGIPGLNKVIDGGFPKESVTLLTGGPGSGKTTFCIQFMIEGLKNDENCLYITTGQSTDEIRRDAKEFDMDFDNYFEGLSMVHVNPSKNIEEDLADYIRDESFDRIVVDSLSIFEMYWGQKDGLRRYLNKLIEHLKELEATVVITSELPEKSKGLSRFGIAEFVVDGVIRLEGFALGDATYRSMQVVKMRRTPVDGTLKGLNLDSSGISIEESEKI